MLCAKIRVRHKGGSVPVHINVYDVTSMNGYADWIGLGIYHSGVEVHGVEYAFGAHESPTSGIFYGYPKKCEVFTFKKTIFIGWTNKTPGEVKGVMDELAVTYRGDAYNLITKNCNHFSNDACIKLTGNPIPGWINRLARIGALCHCIIPVNLNSSKVGNHKIEDKVCEANKKRLRSQSYRSNSSSSSWTSSSSSPPLAPTIGSRNRSPLPIFSP